MRDMTLILFGLLLFGVSCNPITGIDTRDWLTLAPNDDLLSERQKEITQYNATILAFFEMQRQDENFIHIKPALIKAYYNALATILTSDAGRENDAIKEVSISPIPLDRLLLELSPDSPFIENWKSSEITTNISEIDDLLEENGFYIDSIHDWSFSENLFFSLQTKSYLNTKYLATLLDQTGYFVSSGPTALIGGSGSSINYLRTMDGHKFTFINAYGDCPSGCIYHDKYIFMLYENGTVEFLGTQ